VRPDRPTVSRKVLVRWLFLRGLGVAYLIAFASLGRQLLGLYGSRGILPVREYLDRARALPPRRRYRVLPTLLWLGASDRALVRWCRAGQVGAVLLVLGIAPRATTKALWALYLSFVSTGREFLRYQWDSLLLETGLHAMLIAPPGLRPGMRSERPPWPAVALLHWLAFRLHFESGLCKVQSHDPTWRSLTACDYHFATQPLPNRGGWLAHQLPPRAKRVATAAVLAGELGLPFLAFAPRRIRRVGAGALLGLQVSIAATGSYGFFNLLSADLLLWLLDDEMLGARDRTEVPAAPAWRRLATAAEAGALATLSGFVFAQRFDRGRSRWLARAYQAAAPFHAVNPYGLFAVMTTSRPEIVIEASQDGVTWHPYELPYKPGALDRAPRQAAPHQPRLDWQLWFAAMEPPPFWFERFLHRLLEASPDVLALVEHAPFGDRPPRFVRAVLYEYSMTDRETWRRTGEYWQRQRLGLYYPAVMIRR